MSRRRAGGWLAILVVAGLLAGVVVRRFVGEWFRPAELALEPALVVRDEPVLQGDHVTAELVLRNPGRGELCVSQAFKSCGCLDLTDTGGRSLAFPLRIPPAGRVPVRMTVATGAVEGPHTYTVSFVPQGLPEQEFGFRLTILSPLRAAPARLLLEGVVDAGPISGEVELADTLPDPGVEIGTVSTSRPGLLQATLVPLSGSSAQFDSRGRKRYRLAVRFQPKSPDDGGTDWVALTPTDSRYSPVIVPVETRVRRLTVEFEPAQVVLNWPAGAGEVRRHVECRLGGHPANWSVLTSPDFVEASFVGPPEKPRLRIVFRRPGGEGQVVLARAQSADRAVLKVKVVP